MAIISFIFLKIITALKDMANNIRKKLFQEYIEENKMTLFDMPEKISQIVAVSGFDSGTELQTYKNSTFTYSNIPNPFIIPSGAYDTNNVVIIKDYSNIKPSNIKYSVSFGGITGNYTYLSAGAISAGVILTGYTGFVNGSTICGNMSSISYTTLARATYPRTLYSGYYAGVVIPSYSTIYSSTYTINWSIKYTISL
jgi:hypothetical protein